MNFGKNARATNATPATTLIQRLTTFVAPARPMLLDEVSTASPPDNPAKAVEKPSAKSPLRIGVKSTSFNSGSDILKIQGDGDYETVKK